MWYNSIMRWILRAPFHSLLSKNMLLITLTGRKSGKTYTIPINYIRDGDRFLTISYQQRTWWRNLRGGAPVTLQLQGREMSATGTAIEDSDEVATNLQAYLHASPQYARYFQIRLQPNGEPQSEDVVRAAQDKVIIQMDLA